MESRIQVITSELHTMVDTPQLAKGTRIISDSAYMDQFLTEVPTGEK
ncbi:MAG: hypothetical protein P8X79_22390 [Reinekea sp.]